MILFVSSIRMHRDSGVIIIFGITISEMNNS